MDFRIEIGSTKTLTKEGFKKIVAVINTIDLHFKILSIDWDNDTRNGKRINIIAE